MYNVQYVICTFNQTCRCQDITKMKDKSKNAARNRREKENGNQIM